LTFQRSAQHVAGIRLQGERMRMQGGSRRTWYFSDSLGMDCGRAACHLIYSSESLGIDDGRMIEANGAQETCGKLLPSTCSQTLSVVCSYSRSSSEVAPFFGSSNLCA